MLVLAASRDIALEYPRRADEKVGEVNFSTSCNDSAQNEINHAVALLHSFDFSRAIDAFKAVSAGNCVSL